MSTPRLTAHAVERARERNHWTPDALRRMAPRVLAQGVALPQIAGRLRRFLDGKLIKHGKGGNLRVFGHDVFVFQGITLITVYPLPADLRRAADNLQRKPVRQKQEEPSP